MQLFLNCFQVVLPSSTSLHSGKMPLVSTGTSAFGSTSGRGSSTGGSSTGGSSTGGSSTGGSSTGGSSTGGSSTGGSSTGSSSHGRPSLLAPKPRAISASNGATRTGSRMIVST